MSAANDSMKFAADCKMRGLYRPLCGVAVMRLLKGMRVSPFMAQKSGGVPRGVASFMGAAVRAGLARYVPAEKCFVITPAGETWLTELEIHGLAEKEVAA